jgi:hypothetical protein
VTNGSQNVLFLDLGNQHSEKFVKKSMEVSSISIQPSPSVFQFKKVECFYLPGSPIGSKKPLRLSSQPYRFKTNGSEDKPEIVDLFRYTPHTAAKIGLDISKIGRHFHTDEAFPPKEATEMVVKKSEIFVHSEKEIQATDSGIPMADVYRKITFAPVKIDKEMPVMWAVDDLPSDICNFKAIPYQIPLFEFIDNESDPSKIFEKLKKVEPKKLQIVNFYKTLDFVTMNYIYHKTDEPLGGTGQKALLLVIVLNNGPTNYLLEPLLFHRNKIY